MHPNSSLSLDQPRGSRGGDSGTHLLASPQSWLWALLYTPGRLTWVVHFHPSCHTGLLSLSPYFPEPVNLRAFAHTPLSETYTHARTPHPVNPCLSFGPQIKPHFFQKALSDFLSFRALLYPPTPSPKLWSLLPLSSMWFYVYDLSPVRD